GSTAYRPSAARCTARTILLRSTGSRRPLRLVTVIDSAVAGGVNSNCGGDGGAAAAGVDGGAATVSTTGGVMAFSGCVAHCAVPPSRGGVRRTGHERTDAFAASPPRACEVPFGEWDPGVARNETARHRRRLPPETPGPVTARRAWNRAAVGRSSGSWTWREHAFPFRLLAVASRERAPSACDGVRFHIPLRGSAGIAPASLLTQAVVAPGTDGPKIVGADVKGQPRRDERRRVPATT